MRYVLESTTIIDHYPAVIDRYFKHRHSIHKGPFHIYIYIYIWNLFLPVANISCNDQFFCPQKHVIYKIYKQLEDEGIYAALRGRVS